jgi:hypothetical protein
MGCPESDGGPVRRGLRNVTVTSINQSIAVLHAVNVPSITWICHWDLGIALSEKLRETDEIITKGNVAHLRGWTNSGYFVFNACPFNASGWSVTRASGKLPVRKM